jgi:hypothetical protein
MGEGCPAAEEEGEGVRRAKTSQRAMRPPPPTAQWARFSPRIHRAVTNARS